MNDKKKDIETESKFLTETELKRLNKTYAEHQSAKSNLNQLCADKEKAIRKIQAQFESQYHVLEKKEQEKQNSHLDFLSQLQEIYGPGNFRLDNGEILPIKK